MLLQHISFESFWRLFITYEGWPIGVVEYSITSVYVGPFLGVVIVFLMDCFSIVGMVVGCQV